MGEKIILLFGSCCLIAEWIFVYIVWNPQLMSKVEAWLYRKMYKE